MFFQFSALFTEHNGLSRLLITANEVEAGQLTAVPTMPLLFPNVNIHCHLLRICATVFLWVNLKGEKHFLDYNDWETDKILPQISLL